MKADRYRWWDGTAWGDVVAPPPVRGPNKVIWLLAPAFLVVLLAAWAGGLVSPSAQTGTKMAQLADAYEASSDALGTYVKMEVSPENPIADLAAKESAVQQALVAHAQFSAVLSGVTTQAEVGPFPSLEQLRAYDTAAGEFLETQASYMQRLNACSITNRDCYLNADAWLRANRGTAAERLTAAMEAIASQANNYGSQQ